jgi:hypothetical protein
VGCAVCVVRRSFGDDMAFDFSDPNQVLLYWAIVMSASILSLIPMFLFSYWIIRLGVAHGMRSFRRWERTGEE